MVSAVGRPWATSLANEGPVTTASGTSGPSTSSATSCRKRLEPGSKPLVAQLTPACAGAQRRQRAQGVGEGMRGHDHQHQIGVGHGRGQAGGGAQGLGQFDARQVARILVAEVDGLGHRLIASPQHGLVAVPGDQGRQRGPPGTGAEHCDFQRVHCIPPPVCRGPSFITDAIEIRRCPPADRSRSRPAGPGRRAGAGSRRTGRRS